MTGIVGADRGTRGARSPIAQRRRQTVVTLAQISLVLVCLTACAVGPDFVPPDAPGATAPYLKAGEPGSPQSWAGRTAQGDWWRLFGSSELNGMIEQALDHNQDIDAANATLAQVQAQFQATSGLQVPQASLHGGSTREKVNFTSFGFDLPPATQNLYSVGAAVSYAIDIFGHDRRVIETAEARAVSQRFRARAAALTVTGDVVLHALSASALKAQIDILSEVLADDQMRVALVQSARDAGTRSDLDVVAAEQQWASDSAQMAPLRAQWAAVRHGLSVLVGKAPGEWSPPDIALTSYRRPTDIPVVLPSDLVHQRPDILAAEADLHAANAAIGVAAANRFPRLVLTADITQWAKSPNQLWQDMATGAAVGGGLTAPLFQGGQLEALQRAAESGYRVALARYRQTVLQSFAQVATAMQTMAADDEGLTQSTLATNAASRALHDAALQRASGTLGILPLLARRRQERLSHLSTIQAQTQCLKDTAAMVLALGGGWWEPAQHPSPQE